MNQFDLFVVGGGSGGVRAARVAASLGARVGLCESAALGGTCVNVGCVPKKLLYYGSHFAEDFELARAYGWKLQPPQADWGTLIPRKDQAITRLNRIYEDLLKQAQVHLVRGTGQLLDAHTVAVDGERFSAAHILLATGGWPHTPQLPGVELAISSNEVFALPHCPRRVVIAGGGYIAVEFAGIFHGFGAQVHLVHRGTSVLRGFDEDLRSVLSEAMQRKGIDLRYRTEIVALRRRDAEIEVELNDGGRIVADTVLLALGRKPRTATLGLTEAGVRTSEQGGILVDENFRTSAPSIYAVGDVIERVALTPVAIAEGTIVVRRLFAQEERSMSYENIPTAVFSQPTLGTVGLTEEQARARYPQVTVYTQRFRPLKESLREGGEEVFVKLVVDAKSERVLGCHMVGAEAGEIMQGLAVALNCGATKAHFDSTLGIHPTTAEEWVTLRTPRSEPAPQR